MFTVIIPTLNSEKTLQRALSSVIEQKFQSFEIIVADGLSTDSTLQICRTSQLSCEKLRISSERDCGVYDAINRAIDLSLGKWIYVLGSDDALSSNTVFESVAAMLSTVEADIVYGDVRMIGSNRWVSNGARYAGPVDLSFLAFQNVCQQAIFYRQETLIQSGGFESKYHVCADYVHLLKSINRVKIQWINLVICDYATGGLSSSGTDAVLGVDFLRILGDAIMRRPFDPALIPIRAKVKECSIDAWNAKSPIKALVLFLAASSFRMRNYLTKKIARAA